MNLSLCLGGRNNEPVTLFGSARDGDGFGGVTRGSRDRAVGVEVEREMVLQGGWEGGVRMGPA